MFKTTVKIGDFTKGVGVRFFRPNTDLTICELKIGDKNTHPKDMETKFEGQSQRFNPDQFDRCRGHLNAMEKAMNAANLGKEARAVIYKAYGEWAVNQNIRTRISIDKIGN